GRSYLWCRMRRSRQEHHQGCCDYHMTRRVLLHSGCSQCGVLRVGVCFTHATPLRHMLCRLRGLDFFGVLAETRFAVAQRAMMECLLRSSNVRSLALPSLKHRSLQGAA